MKSNNSKLIAVALIMAVVAGGLAFATVHNSKQTAKKVTVPTMQKSPKKQAKTNEERLQRRIDSAIKQKRITEAQAKLIKAKAAEVANKTTDVKDAKARAELQKDLYAWAKENKIPLSFVLEMSRPRA